MSSSGKRCNMPALYEAPDCTVILLQSIDPIALSEGDGDGDDGFQGGVPFGLRDTFGN